MLIKRKLKRKASYSIYRAVNLTKLMEKNKTRCFAALSVVQNSSNAATRVRKSATRENAQWQVTVKKKRELHANADERKRFVYYRIVIFFVLFLLLFLI